MSLHQEENKSYTIDLNTPLSLKTIAAMCFPDGSVTKGKLKKKVHDGLLEAWNIDGELLTSRIEVERMLEKCRVLPNPLDSGIANPGVRNREEAERKGSTSSSMMAAKLAQDAAVRTAQQLKQSLRSSSLKDT
jgi:hypothetical protein